MVGVGNLLMGDEGVGIHAIWELEKKGLRDGVELVELGGATFDLLPYIERADKLIIVDAIKGGAPPGSLHKLREEDLSENPHPTSLHELNFPYILQLAKRKGHSPKVVILGIEPERIEPTLTLTQKVESSLSGLVETVMREIER